MSEMLQFYDTCVRIGRSRAPDPPDNAADVPRLLDCMERFSIRGAAVEHAVARESSARMGHDLLGDEIAGREELRPAWHLMPDVHPRIEKACTDPDEFLARRVALGRVDAKDFCNGDGDRACFAPVLEACSAIRLPVFIDFRAQGDRVGFDYGICERWPRIPFVAEAAGGYPFHRLAWALQEYPNLYIATTGFGLFGGVSLVCEMIGPERIIFGSDWPATSMGVAVGRVSLANIPRETKQQIAGGNFQRLLDNIAKEASS